MGLSCGGDPVSPISKFCQSGIVHRRCDCMYVLTKHQDTASHRVARRPFRYCRRVPVLPHHHAVTAVVRSQTRPRNRHHIRWVWSRWYAEFQHVSHLSRSRRSLALQASHSRSCCRHCLSDTASDGRLEFGPSPCSS